MSRRATRDTWTRVAFGDVVKLCKDRTSNPRTDGLERYVGLEHLEPGDMGIRSWGNIADGTTFTSVFRPGQVLFGKRRAYQRKVAVADFHGVCSSDIYVLEPKGETLLPKLLPFLCQTEAFYQHALKTAAGGLSPRTNWKDLAKFEFPLPPLEEQWRIAGVLWAMEDARTAGSALKHHLACLRQAYVKAAVAEMALDVPVMALGDVADVKYGLTVNQERRAYVRQAPYLRVANVVRGAFDLSEVKSIGVVDSDSQYALSLGDVLIVEGHADPDEIGRAAVWTDAARGVLHQNHLIRVRCGSKLDPHYLCLLINSPHGRMYFRSHAKSSSGLNTINSTVVKTYQLPVPSLGAQAKLVEIARRCTGLHDQLARREVSLCNMVHSVLDWLEYRTG